MDENLIGYLMNALDPDEHRRTELYLRDNAEARNRLEKLRSALEPLACDRDQPAPPAGLVERTMARLAGAVRPQPLVTPARPRDVAHAPPPWRRVDVLVAAGILVVIGGLGTSGLARLHEHSDRVRCQDNMRQYYQSFTNYANAHEGAIPEITDRPPYNKAGSFVPILAESGQLSPQVMVDCPAAESRNRGPVYAYPLGYRDANGHLHGLRLGDDPAMMPILADWIDAQPHGRGFNVMDLGGNVRFSTIPHIGVGGDHIFMNDEKRIKAGLHRGDSVLAPGETPP